MKILFRHGQCEHNILNRISCSLESKSKLTEAGKETIRQSALELGEKYSWYFRKSSIENGDVKVYCSPLLRTRQTAQIICETLSIDPNKIIYDERLKEVDYGIYDECPVSNLPYDVYDIDKFKERGSENYQDINNRINDFLKDSTYCMDWQFYTHIIVSHALPLRVMHEKLTGVNDKLKVGKYFIVKQ